MRKESVFVWGILLVFFVWLVILNTKPNISSAVSTPTQSQVVKAEATALLQTGDTVLVTRVVDGDTIEIEGGQKVRLIGIDTPETVDPRRPLGCFGKEASNRTKELLEGKRVLLKKDVSETDKYGRLLRYVYIDDVFVNDDLVREGYAKSSSYPPDVTYQEKFKQAEEEARASNKGLWGADCGLLSPTVGPATSANCASDTYNCGNFSSCAEVMAVFNQCPNDPNKLDSDNDGVPCEALCR